MAISLDPSINPIMRLYQLFDRPGVEPQDDAPFLGINDVRLEDLGAGQAQALIQFLRKSARGALQTCRLKSNGQPLINFVPGSVLDWFEWDVIDDLIEQGTLAEGCNAVLLDWRQRLDQYALDYYWPRGQDIVSDCLSVLDELGTCAGNGGKFVLEVTLHKGTLLEQHLLEEFPGLSGKVSVLIWRDAESMIQAFDGFHRFLEYMAQAASHPILLLFHTPTAPYQGDYFKIGSLGGPAGTLEARAQALAAQLEAFTTRTLVDYDELRMRHRYEKRPKVGDEYHLPPALLLQQSGHLPAYPSHPLFQEGPLRSVLIYILLAWLAKYTEWQNGTTRFTTTSATPLSLALTMNDVKWEDTDIGTSVFETDMAWQDIVLLLAHDLQRSASREPLRALWEQAVSSQPANSFTATRFFEFLQQVHQKFLDLERASLEMADRQPDLELRIFFKKGIDGGRLEFELHSPRLRLFHEPAGSIDVAATDPKPWLGDLSAMASYYLTRKLVPDATIPALPAVRDLETWGGELWAELIPRRLQEHYVRFRHEQDLNILIVSSDPSFPWELVRPYARRGQLATERIDDVWWAVQFSLARWLAGASPPAERIGFGRICCVAATSGLPNATREAQFFQGLDIELDLPQTKQELIELLCNKRYDILHLSCHGQFDADRPDESAVRLPDGSLLQPRDFRQASLEEMISESRPLVFLNACHSGQAGPTLTGLGGWVERFIDMECGAFIGCGWEVDDSLAADFAIAFYESFRDGESLAKAVHSARQQIKKGHKENSTWLAYYLFGDPSCTLKEPA